MMRLKLAVRSLLRNRRRSILNFVMVAGGFSAIVLFEGFAWHLLSQVRKGAINSQYGHLQIAKEKFWSPLAAETSKERSLDPQAIFDKLRSDPRVDYASGRISFFGLLSSGDQTISAQFIGFDPAVEQRMLNNLWIIEGKNLSAEDKSAFYAIGGRGLIKKLGGKVGDDFTILGHTYDGAVNAMDFQLKGIFQSAIAEVDNATIFIPLSMAQRLLDTELVERVVILLKDSTTPDEIAFEAKNWLGQDLTPRTWYQLADLFRQVEEFFGLQNLIIEVIILLLVLLSISNTVGMSIHERTGEIGTMRALGEKSSDIIKLFSLESLIIGIGGSLLGALFALLVAFLLNSLEYSVVLPGASIPIRLRIEFVSSSFFYATVGTTVTALLATYFPARKITKLEIVEALRHNI